MSNKQLLHALREIRDHGPRDPSYGICTNLRISDVTCLELPQDIVESWPLYSGLAGYPVPVPVSERDNFRSPNHLYHACDNNLGKWTGDYGALRRSLLDHCIAELEAL